MAKSAMSPMSDFLSALDSGRATITVGKGDEAKRFSVPKHLLCQRSTWFEKALREDGFKEGRTGHIDLPEDDPDAFEAFAYYVVCGHLLFRDLSDGDAEQRSLELKLCFKIWMFGDKYLLPSLQNTAMHRACNLFDDRVFTCTLCPIILGECFRISRPESGLRVLIGDYCVHRLETHGPEAEIEENLGSCPGFLAQMHSSEAAFHDLKPYDFPRYKKPVMFSDLFCVEGEDSLRSSGEGHCQLSGGWNKPQMACMACGFSTYDWRSVCKDCRLESCMSWGCDNSGLSILCSSCRSEVKDEEDG